MKTLVIEGWRGISHSFAMVSQYQLVELLTHGSFDLFHRDLPFCLPNWDSADNDPGFPSDMRAAIDSIPPPAIDQRFDAVLRIAFPFARSETCAEKIVTFMVNEWGMEGGKFAAGHAGIDHYCRDNDCIVTPSHWSKTKLIEYGFPEERVLVVPHGVNERVFFPLDAAERAAVRGELEFSDDEFVFLNIGALSGNKGIDCLLRAFSVVRQRHPNARLMLKDASGLYPRTVSDFIEDFIKEHGTLSMDVVLSIYQAPSSLSLDEMRKLYGAVDAYASPYRAEGFNLPVIEAIACGTPAIVTAGGATDDYCDGDVALKVAAMPTRYGAYCGLEPDIHSLVTQMEFAMTANIGGTKRFAQARAKLVDQFSWANAVQALTLVLD